MARWWMLLALWWLLTAGGVPAWAARDSTDVVLGGPDTEFYGPLPSPSQDPLAILVLQPLAEAAALLPAGVRNLTVSLAATSDRRLEDAQGVHEKYQYGLTTLQLNYRQRLRRGELGVQLPVYLRGDDYLAPFIDDYHELFGFRSRQTPDFPHGGYAYDIATPAGTVYAGDSRGTALGELSLSYKQPVWQTPDGRRVLSARASVKAPTGRPSLATSSGSWDEGLGLLYQQRLGQRLQLYGNYDFILTGDPAWPHAQRQNVVQFVACAEYKLRPGLSATAQFQQATNPLTLGNSQSDQDEGELAAGFRGRVRDGRTWSAWLREDIHGNTGPDVTFAGALGWEW